MIVAHELREIAGTMKEPLKPAKLPLPKFRSDKEAAEYFDTHAVTGVWDALATAKPAKPTAALARAIQKR